MKKRILAVVTAAVLALGCTTAAFAADNKYNSGTMNKAYDNTKFLLSGVTTKVDDLIVQVDPIDDIKYVYGDNAQAVGATDLDEAKALMWNMLKKTSGAKSNSDLLAIFNVVYDDINEDEGTELVFFVDGVKAGDKIAMYHWNNKSLDWESGDKWVVTKVTEKHVYAKVKKLSPVAFVKNGKGATTGTSTSTATNTKAATGAKAAPKTGEV